jgi:hypothetical protein
MATTITITLEVMNIHKCDMKREARSYTEVQEYLFILYIICYIWTASVNITTFTHVYRSFIKWMIAWSLPGSPSHFLRDLYKIWCCSFVASIMKSHQARYMAPNKRSWIISTSTQLRAWNFAHWLPRCASTTVYCCIALLQLLYRWQQQSRKLWIPDLEYPAWYPQLWTQNDVYFRGIGRGLFSGYVIIEWGQSS